MTQRSPGRVHAPTFSETRCNCQSRVSLVGPCGSVGGSTATGTAGCCLESIRLMQPLAPPTSTKLPSLQPGTQDALKTSGTHDVSNQKASELPRPPEHRAPGFNQVVGNSIASVTDCRRHQCPPPALEAGRQTWRLKAEQPGVPRPPLPGGVGVSPYLHGSWFTRTWTARVQCRLRCHRLQGCPRRRDAWQLPERRQHNTRCLCKTSCTQSTVSRVKMLLPTPSVRL